METPLSYDIIYEDIYGNTNYAPGNGCDMLEAAPTAYPQTADNPVCAYPSIKKRYHPKGGIHYVS